MIEVPIDKIIPLEEATLEVKKILEDIKDTDIYVITKDGKPHAAIIDIDYLEHLPEIENAGQTKKINEIGSDPDNYDGFEVKPNKPSVEPPVEEAPQETTPEPTPEQPEPQPEIKNPDILNDNVGPWKENPSEEKPSGASNEPPDLNIG